VNTNYSYFRSASHEMLQRPGAILHHGFLCPDFGVGRPKVSWDPSLAMSWVEDGNVILMRGDGGGQVVWPLVDFQAAFQPRFVRSYTHDQLAKERRSSGGDGPWDDTLLEHMMIRGVLTKNKAVSGQKNLQSALRSLLLRKKMERRTNVK
jgi:hypothetical protein